MKFSQNIFLLIIALFAVVTTDAVQSTSTKKRRKSPMNQGDRKRKIKFDDVKPIQNAELGYSRGLQSYPGKTTFPVDTQTLPTTWTSRMGNDW